MRSAGHSCLSNVSARSSCKCSEWFKSSLLRSQAASLVSLPKWERDFMKDHWAAEVLRRAFRSEAAVPPALREDIARLCEIVQGLSYYEFRDLKLAELADALPDCDDLNAVADVLAQAGRVCGFDHASIFLLRHGEAISFDKRVCTSLPPEWLHTYDSERYQYLDPVVARAMSGGEPFLFSDLPDSAPMIQSFWTAAVAHGIGREGCCFVFDLDLDIRIGMSFTAEGTRDAAAATFEANRSDLQVLGDIACSMFVELAGMIRVDRTELSIDELRYLKGLISTTDPSGASALLQDADTQALQRSICYRLGVGTILQALAVVGRERWFDDLPFDSKEVVNSYSATDRRCTRAMPGNGRGGKK